MKKKGGKVIALMAIPVALLGLLLTKRWKQARPDNTHELDTHVRQTLERSEDKMLDLLRATQDRSRMLAENIDEKAIDRIVSESKEGLDKLAVEIKGRLAKAKHG